MTRCDGCNAPIPPGEGWLEVTEHEATPVALCDECWTEAQVEARLAQLDADLRAEYAP